MWVFSPTYPSRTNDANTHICFADVGHLHLRTKEKAARLTPALLGDDLKTPRDRVAVHLLCALVLAQVVADDGQVERCLDVAGIDVQRLLERPLRRLELAQVMVDDAEHLVHVGERRAQSLAAVVCSPELLRVRARSPEQLKLANGLCLLVETAEKVAVPM